MATRRAQTIAGLFALALSVSVCLPASAETWTHKGFDQWHPHQGSTQLAGAGTQCYFCKASSAPVDSDGDGIVDSKDQCPDTPTGVAVDSRGCALDSDEDGVTDSKDQCPTTPPRVSVDSKGCALDSDGDGVVDHLDECPSTPAGAQVDPNGCALDTDGDGVPDYKDNCLGTPSGTDVDQSGCAIKMDTDEDGVVNKSDKCADTPRGASVNMQGCWVMENLRFMVGSSKIATHSLSVLNNVVDVMKNNPNLNIEVQGHTDSRGVAKNNKRLSQKRAQSVVDHLISKGVDRTRLTAKGYGQENPIASNDTVVGRSKNRRVELKPSN